MRLRLFAADAAAQLACACVCSPLPAFSFAIHFLALASYQVNSARAGTPPMACCCVAATAEPLGLLSLRRFSSGDLFPAIHLLLCSSSHASTSMPNESDAGTAAGVAWAGA